jgi:hypothetical protein
MCEIIVCKKDTSSGWNCESSTKCEKGQAIHSRRAYWPSIRGEHTAATNYSTRGGGLNRLVQVTTLAC